MTAAQNALKQELRTISSSISFYEQLIGKTIQKLEKLEGWRPDFEQKVNELNEQIYHICNKMNYEQKQMMEFEIKMNEFAVKKLSNKISIIFNPNKHV